MAGCLGLVSDLEESVCVCVRDLAESAGVCVSEVSYLALSEEMSSYC